MKETKAQKRYIEIMNNAKERALEQLAVNLEEYLTEEEEAELEELVSKGEL